MAIETEQLPLPPFLRSLEAWRAVRGEEERARLADELERLISRTGFAAARLEIVAPPLPALELRVGSVETDGETAIELRPGPDGEAIGRLTVTGGQVAPADARALADAIGLAIEAVRDRERAERADANLAALDAAVQSIAGELDLDRVLQGIVDAVRELGHADYAALGIIDEAGSIQLFLTSGISPEVRELIGDVPQGHGLLGLIIREGRSLRIDDIELDPRRYGFPRHHPEMHPFLGVPLRAQDRIVGNLYLTNGDVGHRFSEEDQTLVERFALHAGIAIQNARLHDRVQRLTIVEERERIGRDLHDTIIQRLYGLSLSLDDVPEMLGGDPAEVRQRVESAIETITGTIREIRTFVFGLQPVEMDDRGIAGALATMAAELDRNTGMKVELDVRLASAPSIEVTAELLSVAREALTNVARHAEATTARISLSDEDGRWRLEIVDDGRGFSPSTAGRPGHRGIANMRQRARKLDGTLRVATRRGRGTRIILTLPR
jgi:signal transduction histidine kinase